MFEFQSISGSEIVTFKEFELPLNKYPLAVIRGRNLDRKDQGKSSNASGKTLSVSTIPNVLYSSLPSSIAKNDAKDMVGRKGAQLRLKIKANERLNLEFHQYFKSSTKLDIIKNSKGLKPRILRDAKDKLRSYFPMTEDQFFSLVFIDGRRPSLLQAGSSKTRFEFFEKIFRLNAYNAISKRVNSEYNKLKLSLQELEIISGELKLKQDDLPASPEELDKMETRLQKVNDSFSELREKIEACTDKLNNAKTYLALVEDLDTQTPMKELVESFKEAEGEEATIKDLLKKSVRYYEQLENHKKNSAKRKKIEAELETMPETSVKIIPELKEKLVRLSKIIDKMETIETNNTEIRKQRKEIKKELEEIVARNNLQVDKIKNMDLKVVQKTISKHKVERKNLEKSITNMQELIEGHDHEDGYTCPTCMNRLNKKSANTVLAQAQKEVERRSKQIARLQAINEYLEIQSNYSSLTLEPVDTNKLNDYFKKLIKWTTLLEKLQRKKELQSILESLPDSDFKEQKIPPASVYEDLLDGLQKRISSLESTISKRKRLEKYNFSFSDDKDAIEVKKNATEKLNNYRPLLDETQAKIQKLGSNIVVVRTLSKDIDRLAKKIDDLKLDTKDFQIFESLRKAFGPKGLRKIRTSFFAKQLEANLNKFSSLIFGEKIYFQLLVSETKFDILAERNGQISDVRKLSGSESSAFTCLLILSILPFIRASDRCNLLILDEIESGFDEQSKDLFVNKFLPVLMQLVKNIFLVTPQSEKSFYIPNAKTYIVIKHKGISKLEESDEASVQTNFNKKNFSNRRNESKS